MSHAALPYPVKGCRFTIGVPYLDSTGTPTDPTTPDTERSIDAGSFADCTEEVTTITGSNGVGYITLTGDEMNGSLIAVCAKVASGPKATIATLYPRVLPVIFSGTATAGAAGTITMSATTPPLTDKQIVGCIIRTTGGTGGAGGSGSQGNQARVITDYVASTRVVTVTPNWETTPDNTTTYEVLLTEAALLRYSDVKQWLGAVVTAATAGVPDANAIRLGNTVQTGRDVGASVLLANPQGFKKNTAFTTFIFALYDTAGLPKTGVTVTAERSIDGAAFGACTNSASEIASGAYKISLSAGDLNGDMILLKFSGSGAVTALIPIRTVQA